MTIAPNMVHPLGTGSYGAVVFVGLWSLWRIQQRHDAMRRRVSELECALAIAKASIENAHAAMDESGIIMTRDKTHQGLTPRVKSIIARYKERAS